MSRTRARTAPPTNGHTPATNPALDALAADPGPLLLTIGVNRVTGKASISYQALDDRDLLLLDDILRQVTAGLTTQRLALAEERGKAAASVA